ncbi:beta-glucosidase [Streptomyces cinereoruber]|uniref:Beta-glucosidase n=1 Tax=Streptomyces cinereoruber TaxID=67260 RepID=A0AAV4KR78_9ACTN|nr:glycoside hydrolase family 3 C-terminal domain-containing protein [Streptomyces cinereoruber]MBB4156141.1 beta-glucosidase [Streptomyces cinereoruber]MBY8819640.1 glycoside hydrolase family 3 C-terminal domain-containing protein [Streptomyces cinereoruber]NIH64952.1 beta-glucosidase [Streptomyces cinereoruber]QEV32616.1 beta-glucosidase [Streptomyces cinereoruber]GGR40987.1 beta-glucosidase [Streptomyces cinereoruber]
MAETGAGTITGTEPGTSADAGAAGEAAREAAVEAALGKLDLDAKARLLGGRDMWSLHPLPEVGLAPLVMSDGPVGVRGVRWTADDPSVALPSPTALAAAWDPALARRAGRLLAQEARRKGVHVLLAPTVNLHRSPLGGRHFEAYSEDPLLTGAIGTGYVLGVQDGGVGTTVKHFVANDAETDRFTVDNRVAPRPLRELYLAPFEAIVKSARPWGIMTAYNQVNGVTMTEHHELVNEVLRGEWGFDGINVSDWTAARSTAGALRGGLDVAMPGPATIYGEALAAAVRAGEVAESAVDTAVRRVLRLAARVGALEGAPPAVTEPPAPIDGDALARELAHRGFVLLRNEPGVRDGAAAVRTGDPVLPLAPGTTVALSGAAARDARVLGGGSAQVFPDHVVSPLDGLAAALPEGALTYAVGADPTDEPAPADKGFALRARCRDAAGNLLGEGSLPTGQVQWIGGDLPDGVTHEALASVEVVGTFTPRETGAHAFGTRGLGAFVLTVAGETVFDGVQAMGSETDPFEAFFGSPVVRAEVPLTAGETVEVSLLHTPDKQFAAPLPAVAFSLVHLGPRRDPDELIAEAVEAARAADTAVVVVATTERVESEGFDRTDLALPGRQDDLVRAVAAANPNTVVVVNAGSPVEMPWREDVAAILLTWFPGQEGGAALADVLTGAEEPGGRLPTTWPAVLADAPVTDVVPVDGELDYAEGPFIGHRAWDRSGRTPAYAFGHGLGYTTWSYDSLVAGPETATVRITNTGGRPGRETVQVYLAPAPSSGAPERPARVLAGFASVGAGPGETVETSIALSRRAFEIWDEEKGDWTFVPGAYEVRAAHSLDDVRLTAVLEID